MSDINVIFGANSKLGRGIIAEIDRIFIDDYSLACIRLNSKRNGDIKGATEIVEINILNYRDVSSFFRKLNKMANGKRVNIFCCHSIWYSQYSDLINISTYKKSFDVNVNASLYIATAARKIIKKNFNIVIFTGLGGQRSQVEGNTPYSIACQGIETMVRSFAQEWAGMAGISAVCIGLVDKGQDSVGHMEKLPGVLVQNDFTDIISTGLFVAKSSLFRFSGGVIEIPQAMLNYHPITRRNFYV